MEPVIGTLKAHCFEVSSHSNEYSYIMWTQHDVQMQAQWGRVAVKMKGSEEEEEEEEMLMKSILQCKQTGREVFLND